ncbi:MAG: hypothetical protein LBD75_07650 [Candidatus Peribacteria bacterium]|jgi:hypothetical protein|nr:hypothetical protein [Candidatus Peribacteria bacterium]
MAKELEKGLEKVSQEVSKATEDVKETMYEVEGRWKKSSLEEKITTVVGIILVARGLRQLIEFIWGIVLLILGGLLVSGYFNTAIKAVINFFKSGKKEKTSTSPRKK